MKIDITEASENIASGIVAGVQFTLVSVVFAGIIFNYSRNELLSNAYPIGINLQLLSSAIGCFTNSLFSSVGISYSAVQDISTLQLALMTMSAVSLNENDLEKLVPTVLYLELVSALLCGVFYIVSGHFKLGKILRYIPYPVMAGFLGSIGYQTLMSSLSLASGIEYVYFWPANFEEFATPNSLAQTALCIAFAFMLTYLPGYLRTRLQGKIPCPINNLWGIIIIFSVPIAFYIVVFASGITLSELRSAGWLNSATSSSSLSDTWMALNPQNVNLLCLAEMIPNILVLVLLCWISALLNMAGLQVC